MREIEIKNLPEIKLVCVKAKIRDGQTINRQLIPELWSKLSQLVGHFPRHDENRYALITGDLPGLEENESYYLAGLRVDLNFNGPLPEDFFIHKIEPGIAATIRHRGSPMTLGQTAEKIFRSWLPKSDYKIRINKEMTIFSPEYNREDPLSSFNYVIFLKEE